MEATTSNTSLATRLREELEGEVLFDRFSRGRYSTDASIYQIQPVGVVIPRHTQDVVRTLQIAAEHGTPITPRGAGTSQGGQAIGNALIIDTSKYLTSIRAFEPAEQTISVEPGIVLDRLNDFLKPHGLFFPVDVATASQATIGGMAGNNSAGARSIRYGHMVDNVHAIDALLEDGSPLRCGPPDTTSPRAQRITSDMRALYDREADEIARRFPQVARNVAGYNLDRLGRDDGTLADLLVGSEGTLAWFAELHLALQPLPQHKVLGVCHFPTFHDAMESTQHIVTLEPSAVELIDRTVIDLARETAAFHDVVDEFVVGNPAALLVVEFAGDDRDDQLWHLGQLNELLDDLGFAHAVVPAVEPELQQAIWSVRKAALNIVMSMKGDSKPVSFIEDCAVPLEALGAYTDSLGEVFKRHGTTGTWYAHASVGCLHIRPALNLKDVGDVAKMRTIAEEAHALVREYKGSHSGEHGDGIVRSEFLEPMLGPRIARAFEEIKQAFDPHGRLNPGKIVGAPRMDDRSLLRFPDGYAPEPLDAVLDWSEWGGFDRAAEMCNNNGACRRLHPGVMCPSYRVTQDEQHTTRGRANTLRLALTGQLGPDALTSDAMFETMDLCVGCKACKRECPTGVDMSRMKTEFLHHYRKRHGLSWKDRIVAYVPRYAPWAARLAFLANLANHRSLAGLRQRLLGFTAQRPLPRWRRSIFRGVAPSTNRGREVVLFADTFSTYFEPDVARDAADVLTAFGYRVITPRAADRGRPLCCGRTFLNSGLVDEARIEARRVFDSLAPFLARGIPVVGLEPSCLLTLRDEFAALLPPAEAALLAEKAFLFEEFLAAERAADRLKVRLRPLPYELALVHGHCHQKAFGLMETMAEVVNWVPDLTVETVETGCCGMAGSFGYEAEHYDISMQMAELGLLPAIRAAHEYTLVVADGTSCRRQIADGTGRVAWHTARVLAGALRRER